MAPAASVLSSTFCPAGQIVHDDDVALAQLRRKDALDTGPEGEPVDRGVEHEMRDHAACGQGGDEGRCFPVAVRNADAQAPAAAAAAAGSGHVAGRPGLVDEHETLGVEIELAFEPRLAALQDVRPILFAGARSLFLGVIA
jgi:hypothetical protein